MNGDIEDYPSKSGGFAGGFKVGFDMGLLGLRANKRRQQQGQQLRQLGQPGQLGQPVTNPSLRRQAQGQPGQKTSIPGQPTQWPPRSLQPIIRRPFTGRQPGLLDLGQMNMGMRS